MINIFDKDLEDSSLNNSFRYADTANRYQTQLPLALSWYTQSGVVAEDLYNDDDSRYVIYSSGLNETLFTARSKDRFGGVSVEVIDGQFSAYLQAYDDSIWDPNPPAIAGPYTVSGDTSGDILYTATYYDDTPQNPQLITFSGAGSYKIIFPKPVVSRGFKLVHSGTAAYKISRIIPRRAVQAFDLEVNAIKAYHVSAELIETIALEVSDSIVVGPDLIGDKTLTGAKIVDGTVSGVLITPGTITGNLVQAGTISGVLITAGTITADRIASKSLTASQIADAAITGSLIQAGTVSGVLITDNAISASKIQANTITGDKIAAATISGTLITAGTITADRIATKTLTASQIADATITGSLIQAGTVSGVLITDNAISASKIQANTITGDKIAALTISGSLITANAITADKIAAGSVTATKINVNNLAAINTSTGSLLVTGTITVSGSNSEIDAGFTKLTQSGITVGNFVNELADTNTLKIRGKVNPEGGNVVGMAIYNSINPLTPHAVFQTDFTNALEIENLAVSGVTNINIPQGGTYNSFNVWVGQGVPDGVSFAPQFAVGSLFTDFRSDVSFWGNDPLEEITVVNYNGVTTTQAFTGNKFFAKASGTAANPIFSFELDSDTGLFSEADNTLSLTAGGVTRLSASSTGVSVDTSLSSFRSGDNTFANVLEFYKSRGTRQTPTAVTAGDSVSLIRAYAYQSNNTYDEITRITSATLTNTDAGILAFHTAPTGGAVTERMRITSNGQILIQDNSVSNPALSFLNDPDTGFYRVEANAVRLSCGGVWSAYFDQNRIMIPDGSVGTPGMSFINAQGTGLYNAGSNNIAMTHNGTERFRFYSGGQLSVDTTNANGQLTIEGGTRPTITLRQLNDANHFINFVCNTVNATTTPVNTGALGTYYGRARVQVNGTTRWIALYN